MKTRLFQWMLAAILICGTSVFISCSSNEDNSVVPVEPDHNIADNIIGKWMITDVDGQSAPTDMRRVVTFVSATKAYMSASIAQTQEGGNKWDNQTEADMVIDDNKITLTIYPNENAVLVHEFTVTDINGSEFTAYLKVIVPMDGNMVNTREGTIRFTKVPADYSEDVLGTWEGRCTSEGSVFDDGQEHRWEYKADGTFVYYVKDGDNWVPSDNSLNEYFVDGTLLCTRWVNQGQENREWWEITIDEGKMNWTALRQNTDGTTFTTTFEMKKVLTQEDFEQNISGKWYAENNTPGSINVDGNSIDYQKVVQYANFRDDGTGFWSIIFVDENSDAIDIPNHFCGGQFNYTVNGDTLSVEMTSSGIPIMEDNWDVTYSNGTISVNAPEAPSSLTPMSPEMDADCQRWLRQLGFGYSGSLMLSDAETSHCGMVVCAEGHLHEAKHPVPEGCIAVGVLGKVTRKGHGLIICLFDAYAQTCHTINSWKTGTDFAGIKLKMMPEEAYGKYMKGYTKLGDFRVTNWGVGQKKDYCEIFKNLGCEKHNGDEYAYDKNVDAHFRYGVGGRTFWGSYWTASEEDRFSGSAFYDMWFGPVKSMEHAIRPVMGF
jgi:hypothetical protein